MTTPTFFTFVYGTEHDMTWQGGVRSAEELCRQRWCFGQHHPTLWLVRLRVREREERRRDLHRDFNKPGAAAWWGGLVLMSCIAELVGMKRVGRGFLPTTATTAELNLMFLPKLLPVLGGLFWCHTIPHLNQTKKGSFWYSRLNAFHPMNHIVSWTRSVSHDILLWKTRLVSWRWGYALLGTWLSPMGPSQRERHFGYTVLF